ncbi:MAG: DUF4280 domain-containing protein [Lachnospiraceae bacterium]|nr:DUF4280 domain-containing protein [Lachnospiraceae bacterium]
MSELAIMGAKCVCSFGQMPADLKVTSQQKVLTDGKPTATIQDVSPMANIGPFGLCSSLANPTVAAATAAALGVLTPQPCVPAPAGTWIPTKPTIIVSGIPVLCSDCKMMCAYAGNISIVMPGQMKVTAS